MFSLTSRIYVETWANSVNCKIVTSNIGHRVYVINEKKNVNQEGKKTNLKACNTTYFKYSINFK